MPFFKEWRAARQLQRKAEQFVKLVIAEGMSPALGGIAVGALVAVASARVLQTLAFGISGTDPPTLAAVSAILAVVAVLASLVPAYGASRFDPAKVLRAD